MEISDIKQQLTLAQILHYYHLKPDKNMRLCYPFHDDKTALVQVYCKTHSKHLDVIDFAADAT